MYLWKGFPDRVDEKGVCIEKLICLNVIPDDLLQKANRERTQRERERVKERGKERE